MVAVVPGLAPMTSGRWEVAARANPGSWNCGNDHVPPGCSAGLHEPSAWLERESSARVKEATVRVIIWWCGSRGLLSGRRATFAPSWLPTTLACTRGTRRRCPSMDYEAVRLALGLADGAGSEWASIKSAGRQGVARAFQEGGVRKARLKLTKVIAAARVPGESVPSEKKRRRRANQRERAGLNRRGALTDVQLFTLFATQCVSNLGPTYLQSLIPRPLRAPSGMTTGSAYMRGSASGRRSAPRRVGRKSGVTSTASSACSSATTFLAAVARRTGRPHRPCSSRA